MKFRLPVVAASVICLLASVGWSQQFSDGQSNEPDYRSRTIYFLMADRFNPHQPYAPYVDPLHPSATNTLNCFEVPCTKEEQFRSYWGGDIQGIIQRLNYLDHLGVSAVWITPLMENVRAYVSGTGYGTGYHGYWVQNYYRVNAHFGDWSDVDQLSHELHARGMRYMQDITLNHSNPLDNHVNGLLYQSPFPDQVFINSYEDDYDPLTGNRYYKHYENTHACRAAKRTADYDWTYWQLHHCLLADLSGYDQRDPAVANYLIGAGETWIDHGVDDYRLDAVKFPFPEFIANFTASMRDHLTALHRPAPYFVGEWSNGGVGDAKSLKFANKYDFFGTNILDFQLSFILNQFIGGVHEDATRQTSGTQLDQFLQQRVTAFEGRDSWQGTFLDNHDQIRTLVRLQKIGVTDEGERDRRMDLGTVLLMTVRGIPIIYYGDEQYLAHYDDENSTKPIDINTGNDDPYNRPGLNRWAEDTPAFNIIHKLAQLRKESPALWDGEYVPVYSDDDVLVFERVGAGRRVLVAVNRGEGKSITIPGQIGFRPGEYTGVLANGIGANARNYLTVTTEAATIYLDKLSSLVVEAHNHTQP